MTVLLACCPLLAACGVGSAQVSTSARNGGTPTKRPTVTDGWRDYYPQRAGRACRYTGRTSYQSIETLAHFKYATVAVQKSTQGEVARVRVTGVSTTTSPGVSSTTTTVPVQTVEYTLRTDGQLDFPPFGSGQANGTTLKYTPPLRFPPIGDASPPLTERSRYDVTNAVGSTTPDLHADATFQVTPFRLRSAKRVGHKRYEDVVGVRYRLLKLTARGEGSSEGQQALDSLADLQGTTALYFAQGVGLIQLEVRNRLASSRIDLDGCSS